MKGKEVGGRKKEILACQVKDLFSKQIFTDIFIVRIIPSLIVLARTRVIKRERKRVKTKAKNNEHTVGPENWLLSMQQPRLMWKNGPRSLHRHSLFLI